MGVKVRCRQDPGEWHRWFAWFPVTISRAVHTDDGKICATTAWWVWVERRKHYGYIGSSWSYRLLEGPAEEG